jgi:hypothetical protein
MTMKNDNIVNLVVAIGVILFGVNLLVYTGAYSYKTRAYVEFLPSPIKEIFGVLCIIWGSYFAYVVFKGTRK